MSLETLAWALQIRGVSPIAKLLAVFILDGKQENSPQEFAALDAAAFACCSFANIGPALRELEAHHGFEVDLRDDGIFFADRTFERRSPEPPPSDHDLYIYVVTAHGRSKIGISVEPTERFRRMATAIGLPTPPTPLLLVKGPAKKIRRAEVAALNSLVKFNTSGEWFSVESRRAIEAVKAALRAENIDDGG